MARASRGARASRRARERRCVGERHRGHGVRRRRRRRRVACVGARAGTGRGDVTRGAGVGWLGARDASIRVASAVAVARGSTGRAHAWMDRVRCVGEKNV